MWLADDADVADKGGFGRYVPFCFFFLQTCPVFSGGVMRAERLINFDRQFILVH